MKQPDSIYECLYECFKPNRSERGWLLCFYCGDPADTMDHQPPITRVSDYRALKLENEVFVKVPSCRECNVLLGNALTTDLLDREALLKERLVARYKKIARTCFLPGEAKAEGIRGSLLKKVEGYADAKLRFEKRRDYFGGVSAWIHQWNKKVAL